MQNLSRLLDETTALLDIATSGDLRAALRARRASLEAALMVERIRPAARPDPETWAVIRNATLTRYGYRCALCRSQDALDVHHIVAVAEGGETVPQNLVALCRACHAVVHPWIEEAEHAT